MKKKHIILSFAIFGLVILIIALGCVFDQKSKLLGKLELFKKDKENKVVGTVVSSEETLNLKEIEEAEEIIVADIKEDVVVVDKPIVEEKENKKEITKEEIEHIEAVSNSVNESEIASMSLENEIAEIKEIEDSKNEFVKFERNDKTIAAMQAKIFTVVPREWLFSGGKIVIDSTEIDETTEYITMNDINKELFINKTGNIRIFAYDEIWNNGTDYVLRTRCYVR